MDPAEPSPAKTLRSPKEARDEIQMLRSQLDKVKEFKETQRFLTKRERVISNAWRHGIFGIDDADSQNAQVFY